MKKLYYIIIFLFVAIALQAQTIIYVKPNGVGDGSSWVKACDFIGLGEACLARTGPNVQIWVQKGTYYPSEMLSVPNSVKMYGGFSGTESNLSQRDSLSNSTIIDAQQKFGSVIRLGVSSELNGFVIQNGHAQDNPHKNGGGIFADDNSVIANCLIINNTASARGGGVYSKGTIKIIGSTIKDNMAIGGGANVFGNCLTVLGRSDEVVPVQPEEPIIPVEPKEPETPIVATGCVDGAFSLGTVSFASETTRTITGTVDGQSITQVWSDAVTATGCQKTAFDGGSSGTYKTDCRSNPSYPGDLFSWCAVVKNAAILCPAPWRVPTKDDFINLDKAMGGTGENRSATSELPKYLGTGANQWGSAYGGLANTGSLGAQGLQAYYWSRTEYDANHGYGFGRNVDGRIYPQYNYYKYYGFSLRCVR